MRDLSNNTIRAASQMKENGLIGRLIKILSIKYINLHTKKCLDLED